MSRRPSWIECIVWAGVVSLAISPLAGQQSAEVEGPSSVSDTPRSYEGFAKYLEHVVNARNVAGTNRCFDLPSLLERSCAELDVPESFRAGFEHGVAESFNWGTAMAAGLGETGHYRLLSLREVNGKPSGLFRLVTADGGLNYHDVQFTRDAAGRPAIEDVYVHLSAEKLSETIRRSVVQGLRSVHENDPQVLATFRQVRQMTEHMQNRRFEQALAVYGQLPAETQVEKTVLIMRVTCASQVSVEATEAACDAFRAQFPDDTCLELVTLDQHVMAGRWDRALAAVESIRTTIFDDPHLDVIGANIQLMAGNTDAARTFAQRAHDREPDSDAAVWTLLAVDLEQGNHDQVARWLTTLETEFAYEFGDLESIEAYTDFVQSAPYQTWRSSQIAVETNDDGM